MKKKILMMIFGVCFILPITLLFSGCAKNNDIPNNSNDDSGFTPPAQTTTYQVSYILNDGTNHADNPTVYTEDTEDITLKEPTRVGYEFLGWYTDGLYGVNEENKVEKITKDTKKDLVLNAKWRGLWYFNGSPQLTDYAKGLDVIHIVPEINDSFGSYSSNSFSIYMNLNKTYVYHEGVKSVELKADTQSANTRVKLPSTIEKLIPYFISLNNISLHFTDMDTLFNLDTNNKGAFCNGAKFYIGEEQVVDLVIPEGVSTIANNMFLNAIGIKTITIPDSVTTIGTNSFDGIDSLEKIYIGSGLISVGDFKLGASAPDLYVKDDEMFYRLTTMLNADYYNSDWFKGRVFVDEHPLTKLEFNQNVLVDIRNLIGIENIIFKNGVTTIGELPNVSGYVIIPNSVTSIEESDIVSSRLVKKSNYYFMGSKEEFQAKNISIVRDGNLYYYSFGQPIVFGKHWKYDIDGTTPITWDYSYTKTPSKVVYMVDEPIYGEAAGYSISPIDICNGDKYLYLKNETNFNRSMKVFIEDDGKKIEIGSFTSAHNNYVSKISFKSNVAGYTNENGEWIYGICGGNEIKLIMEPKY